MSCCLALYTPSMVPVMVTWDFLIGFIFTSFTSGNIIWNKILFKCNKREWRSKNEYRQTAMPAAATIRNNCKQRNGKCACVCVSNVVAVIKTTCTTTINMTTVRRSFFSSGQFYTTPTFCLCGFNDHNGAEHFLCTVFCRNDLNHNKHSDHSTAWICASEPLIFFLSDFSSMTFVEMASADNWEPKRYCETSNMKMNASVSLMPVLTRIFCSTHKVCTVRWVLHNLTYRNVIVGRSASFWL